MGETRQPSDRPGVRPGGEAPRADGSARRRAILTALRETRLDPSYALAVEPMIDEDDDGWPACCGSSCDPCVLTLAQAARRARELLREGA